MNEEASLQISAYEMIQRLRPVNAKVFHIPNGEVRDKGTARKLKLMGVEAGVADFEVMLRGGRTGYIELKASKGSLRPSQIRFRESCTLLGHEYVVCRSVEQVIQALWEMGVNFENSINFENSVIEMAH